MTDRIIFYLTQQVEVLYNWSDEYRSHLEIMMLVLTLVVDCLKYKKWPHKHPVYLETFAGALLHLIRTIPVALFGGATAGARAFTNLSREMQPNIKGLKRTGI